MKRKKEKELLSWVSWSPRREEWEREKDQDFLLFPFFPLFWYFGTFIKIGRKDDERKKEQKKVVEEKKEKERGERGRCSQYNMSGFFTGAERGKCVGGEREGSMWWEKGGRERQTCWFNNSHSVFLFPSLTYFPSLSPFSLPVSWIHSTGLATRYSLTWTVRRRTRIHSRKKSIG